MDSVKGTKGEKKGTKGTNGDVKGAQGEDKEKKVFDKKAYRIKKYDKKTKVDDWKNKRQSFMTHKYKKLQKKLGSGLDVGKIYEEEEERKPTQSGPNSQISHPNSNSPKPGFKKPSSLDKAKKVFKQKMDERNKKEAEFQRRQAEKVAKQKIYKEKKDKRYKTIKAKTKNGQPLMGGRIDLLLERIQQTM